VRYTVIDSLKQRGRLYTDVVKLEYDVPLLHGFDTLYFADGIGIIALVDNGGRWPIRYNLEG
jgi:hypothetical protein